MKFSLTQPCKDCPFRISPLFHLGTERRKEISEALQDDTQTFPCHKTLQHREPQHCAGAIIVLEKMGMRSIMLRLAMRTGTYDPGQLQCLDQVYDSWKTFESAEEIQAPVSEEK
ncbi:DUF6283 family protein [Leptolyngbya sp. AN03gr2]|uniref:DUF6283 family protein n=1 Tax=unclassified Leptolyngbya TaxID=2650499 RepID=UPI003D3128DF